MKVTQQPTFAGRIQPSSSTSSQASNFSGVLQSIRTVAQAGDQILKQFIPGASSLLGNPSEANFERMWQVQEQNQAFNLQYLELQNALQATNREFSTLSNLMKARHDTAKAAINNMHV